MNILESVSKFISTLRIKEIPSAVMLEAKKTMMDCVGVSIAAIREPCLDILRPVVQKMGGHPHSTLLGTNILTSPAWAALYNGTMAHVLDFDDSAGLHIPLHPSAPVLPAVVALGEFVGASGSQVLEAYIGGLEVECKLAKGCTRESYSWGWHATGIFGTMGAAAGAAKLLGLKGNQVNNTMGLALSHVGGARQNFGTMVKSLHAGNAAMNGVLSALLAQDGFTASDGALDGVVGFGHLFHGKSMTEECSQLGKPYHLANGFNIKKYPSCHATHAAIDAILEIIEKYHIDYREIKEITCRSNSAYVDGLPYVLPKTPLEAKFSMHFLLSLACVYGEVSITHFSNDMLQDTNVMDLRKKVNFLADDTIVSPASTVTVELKNNDTYSVTVDKPRGDVGYALSLDEVQDKFRSCAAVLLSDDDAQRALDTILTIETLDNISYFTSALRCEFP